MIRYSRNIFDLAEVNCHVKNKAEEYAEENNVEMAGEYFILHYRTSEKIDRLIKSDKCFRQ